MKLNDISNINLQHYQDLWPTIRQLFGKPIEYISNKIYIGNAGNVKIYAVNGDYVKEHYDMDFVEGGNDKRYPDFIPSNEVWVDINLDKHEWPFVAYHEFVERDIMIKYGMEYDNAHDIANELEKDIRI